MKNVLFKRKIDARDWRRKTQTFCHLNACSAVSRHQVALEAIQCVSIRSRQCWRVDPEHRVTAQVSCKLGQVGAHSRRPLGYQQGVAAFMGALKYPHKTTDRFHHNLKVARALKNNLIFSCSFSYYYCEWTASLQQLIHLPLLLQNIVFLVNRKGLNYHDHSFYKESTTSFTWRISLQSRKSCFREIFFIMKRENKNRNKIDCVHDEGIKRIQCTEPHRV